jgi:hypothetical protein
MWLTYSNRRYRAAIPAVVSALMFIAICGHWRRIAVVFAREIQGRL